MTIRTRFATPVPMPNWSKAHWSQLAYVETCCVDDLGRLDPRRMRDKHREGVGSGWKPSYGTLLKDGTRRGDHDDFDVMDDLRAAGLVEPWTSPSASVHRRVALTGLGQRFAAELRAHKADGGQFFEFEPSAELLAQT